MRFLALVRFLALLIGVLALHELDGAEDVEAFVADFGPDGPYPNLRLRGFMTMAMIADPSSPDGDEDVRRCFATLRELRDRLAPDAPDGVTLDELSMGMSGDFELAIAEGATTVRVGRAIFGALWQNATARALRVNPRQVHRWVSGKYEPGDGVIRDLIAVARQKRAEIDEAIRAASE